MKSSTALAVALLLLQASSLPVPSAKTPLVEPSQPRGSAPWTVKDAASTGTSLSVSPPYNGFKIGALFTISVDIADVPNLYSYDFYLDYNSTNLGLLGASCETGTMFGSMPHFVVACGAGNSTGSFHVAETLEGNILASGSGHLLILNFTVSGAASGASALHIANEVLIDSNFADVPHTTIDGVFYVDLPPVASFKTYPQGGEKQLLAGRALVFNASASRDPDSTYDPNGPVPLVCNWDFGDESLKATGCVLTHTYSLAGTYNVVLSVTDNEGSTNTTSSPIDVLSNPDLDGSGCVDIRDIARVAFRFGTKVGDALYNPLFDVNDDGTINILDLVLVASSYGQCGFPVLDFSMTSTTTSLTVSQGSPNALSLAFTSMNEFTGNITLTTAISPTVSNPVHAILNQTTVSLPSGTTRTVALSLAADNSTTTGTYSIGVFAASEFRSHSLTISVLVIPPQAPEALRMEMYSFPGSVPTNTTLFIRNAGSSTASLTAYYVKDASGNTWANTAWTNGPSIAVNQVVAAMIGIGGTCGSSCTLSGSGFTQFTAGNSYTITVVTSHGNQFTFTIEKGSELTPAPPAGESLVLQNYSFATSNSTSVTLDIEDNGTTSVSLVTYYVTDANGDLYARTSWAGPSIAVDGLAITAINIGASCSFCTLSGTAFSFTTGSSYKVFIVTSKNNEFVFTITR